MSEAEFLHYDLKLIEPSFGSELTDLIIELDYLRKKPLGGSTHPKVFFQLNIFFTHLKVLGQQELKATTQPLLNILKQNLKAARKLLQELKKFRT